MFRYLQACVLDSVAQTFEQWPGPPFLKILEMLRAAVSLDLKFCKEGDAGLPNGVAVAACSFEP